MTPMGPWRSSSIVAAAPQMLEALKLAQSHIEASEITLGKVAGSETVRRSIEQAINRAEGRA